MTVKQLYEILGMYIRVGAGEWSVKAINREKFKTQKEYKMKSKLPISYQMFDIGEVLYFAVREDDLEYEEGCAILLPPLLFKDESRAFYNLPPADFVSGNRTPLVERQELIAKASNRSKTAYKKSTKTTKGAKKK